MWRFTSHKRPLLERGAPCLLPQALNLSSAKRVLVFAPHPDDESLGCGGTLALLSRNCLVRVVLVTDGSGAGELPDGSDATRQNEFRQALAQLGVDDVLMMDCPDGAFVADAEVLARFRRIFSDYQPDWVFLPSPLDYHRDHVGISAALEPMCRRCSSVTHLMFYEIWSPVPATHVVDITEVAELKRSAIRRHATALSCADYLGAIEGLNKYRGLYIGPGRIAEAFWVEEKVSRASMFAMVKKIGQSLLLRLSCRPLV